MEFLDEVYVHREKRGREEGTILRGVPLAPKGVKLRTLSLL